jgi:hypothetical protein
MVDRGSGFQPRQWTGTILISRLKAAPTHKINGTLIFNLMESVERNAGQQILYQIAGFRTIILFEMVLKGIHTAWFLSSRSNFRGFTFVPNF